MVAPGAISSNGMVAISTWFVSVEIRDRYLFKSTKKKLTRDYSTRFRKGRTDRDRPDYSSGFKKDSKRGGRKSDQKIPQATMSRISQFAKDFLEPRSARMSVFNVSQQPPMGSILHCVTNQQIFCKDK